MVLSNNIFSESDTSLSVWHGSHKSATLMASNGFDLLLVYNLWPVEMCDWFLLICHWELENCTYSLQFLVFCANNTRELYPVSSFLIICSFYRWIIYFSINGLFYSFIIYRKIKNGTSSYNFKCSSIYGQVPILSLKVKALWHSSIKW